jgi:hypothetical protein
MTVFSAVSNKKPVSGIIHKTLTGTLAVVSIIIVATISTQIDRLNHEDLDGRQEWLRT